MFLKGLLISITLLSFTNQAWSQADDETKLPINIEADTLHAQEQQGFSIYEGDVVATQGSLTLEGQRLEINHPNQQLQRLVITGKPAKFKRYLPEQKAWVTGHADTIIYHAQAKLMDFIGEAHIEQERTHTISGPSLQYDLDKETLQASGTSAQPGRVSVTITPQ